MRRISQRFKNPDFTAMVVLAALWLLFFWRLFTPVDADRVSLVEGDFDRQFVTFGAYQYQRFAEGEIPLWNPFNNGGLPFIADTQAAVFYPPRLVTIALCKLTGGWTYNALQLEMIAHVLAYTVFMYALVRRLTASAGHISVIGALFAAIIAGYGGFVSGYPPLQLALLEAGIWLPLALLGIVEATQSAQFRRGWLLLTGFALGVSWMAGHPQTSWFATYLVVFYLAYRIYSQKHPWRMFFLGVTMIGAVTIGITAVQLFPGFEYLRLTTRTGMGFDAKANGFPLQDVIQFIFPSIVSVWSPLYVGVSGLVLAGVGLAGQKRERIFWSAMTLIALGWSFGKNAALFYALYNLLPGLQFFRQQERAAYLVSNSLAILAGVGVINLYLQRENAQFVHKFKRGLGLLAGVCLLVAVSVFTLWIGDNDNYRTALGIITFITLIIGLLIGIIGQIIRQSRPVWWALLVALLVFELFTINIDNTNYTSIPAEHHAIMIQPPLITQVKEDTAHPYRVDGGLMDRHIGLYGWGNAGSMYGVQDIQGISPLFLAGPSAFIQQTMPPPVTWEIFAVKYVFTDWEVLPVESEIIARDYPDGRTLNLHHLQDSRPFALMMYDYVVVDDGTAYALLADGEVDARQTIILARPPEITLPGGAPEHSSAYVTAFEPEYFVVRTQSTENAILSVAHVDYPGWEVVVDGNPVTPIRAYGALVAIPLEAGAHTITFQYRPQTFYYGALLSLFTWAGLGIVGAIGWMINRRKRNYANK